MGIAAHAQSAGQDWEKAAGGKQEFEVASVREDNIGGNSYSNLTLDGGSNAYWVMNNTTGQTLAGTLFSAKNQTLMRYIVFAYKLSGTQELALRFDYYARARVARARMGERRPATILRRARPGRRPKTRCG